MQPIHIRPKLLSAVLFLGFTSNQALALDQTLEDQATNPEESACVADLDACGDRAIERWERCTRSPMSYGCYSQLKRDIQQCLNSYFDCKGLPRKDIDDLIIAD